MAGRLPATAQGSRWIESVWANQVNLSTPGNAAVAIILGAPPFVELMHLPTQLNPPRASAFLQTLALAPPWPT